MQQFIPFEDDWDALERLSIESLMPYRVGLPCQHDLAEPPAQRTVPTSPSTFSTSPSCAPMRVTVPAGSSST